MNSEYTMSYCPDCVPRNGSLPQFVHNSRLAAAALFCNIMKERQCFVLCSFSSSLLRVRWSADDRLFYCVSRSSIDTFVPRVSTPCRSEKHRTAFIIVDENSFQLQIHSRSCLLFFYSKCFSFRLSLSFSLFYN